MPCLIKSQDTTKVSIDRVLLPLWYGTIVELELQKVVNDSLRATIIMHEHTIKYQVDQTMNLERQVSNLETTNRIVQEQAKISKKDSDAMTRAFLKWRSIAKIGFGAAFVEFIIIIVKAIAT